MSFNNTVDNLITSSGNPTEYLRNNGVNQAVSWAPIANAGSGISQLNVVVFTANGTYTPSVGLAYAVVELVGGGGGGGGTASVVNKQRQGSGGGAGGYTRKLFTAAELLPSQSVVIGGGGAGGVGNGAPSNGSSSTFGSLLTATGGLAGASSGTSDNVVVPGGLGGVGSGGDFNDVGERGETNFKNGDSSNSGAYTSGKGGASFFGCGGKYVFSRGVNTNVFSNGNSAFNYGAGGSGAASSSGTSAGSPAANGGAGASGVCIITEYII